MGHTLIVADLAMVPPGGMDVVPGLAVTRLVAQCAAIPTAAVAFTRATLIAARTGFAQMAAQSVLRKSRITLPPLAMVAVNSAGTRVDLECGEMAGKGRSIPGFSSMF